MEVNDEVGVEMRDVMQGSGMDVLRAAMLRL